MYDWQANPHFTSRLKDGQRVKLNELWSGYEYLKREFGHLFPNVVKENHGDIIVIHAGQQGTRFARQCLEPIK